MRGFVNSICILILAGGLAAAQTTPAKASPAKSPAKSSSADAGPALPSEATVDSFLQQTFGYQPDLSWRISSIRPAGTTGLAEVTVVMASGQGQQGLRFYTTPDGEHALFGDMVPFGARPFDPVKKLLDSGVTGPERGPKDAPVMIVEFGDLQCPACKLAQPSIESLVESEPNVRFVFQNFPLVEVHNWAAKGAAYADCVGQASNDAFWKFIESVYGAQTDISTANADEKLTGFADAAGVKGTEIAACAAKPETTTHVEHSLDLGKALDVNSTPTIFINGRKLGAGGIPYEVLVKLVDFAAQQGK